MKSDNPNYYEPPDELKGKLEFDDYTIKFNSELRADFMTSRGITRYEFIKDAEFYDYCEEAYAEYLDTEDQREDYSTGISGEEN